MVREGVSGRRRKKSAGKAMRKRTMTRFRMVTRGEGAEVDVGGSVGGWDRWAGLECDWGAGLECDWIAGLEVRECGGGG